MTYSATALSAARSGVVHPARRTARSIGFAVASLSLAACTAPLPAPDIPVITVASGSFYGSSSTQIFADGTLVSQNAGPGTPSKPNIQHGSPDAYTRAAAVLAKEGVATKRTLKVARNPCLDYGTDQVSATPPVAGFDQASAACPDPALGALMDHVLGAIAQP